MQVRQSPILQAVQDWRVQLASLAPGNSMSIKHRGRPRSADDSAINTDEELMLGQCLHAAHDARKIQCTVDSVTRETKANEPARHSW